MCGIAGVMHLSSQQIPDLECRLRVMNQLQAHRGPDGEGIWQHPGHCVGFGHRRLSIIDLSPGAQQPMTDHNGNWVTFNGEIYNYVELRTELGPENFATRSDTEVILLAYRRWGTACVEHMRGMFAFALWDERNQCLFCVRDRFGVKPFYYALIGDTLYFASEVKALLPFLNRVEINVEGLKDYLTFQFCLAGKTLFKDVCELLPGHALIVKNSVVEIRRYWEVYYTLDLDHTTRYFEEQLRVLLADSIDLHLRSDVPLGAYLSGGLDSSVVTTLASRKAGSDFMAFTGKFSFSPDYDESRYARAVAERCSLQLMEIDITVQDFIENIQRVVYYLDYPSAGPGSFSQYMVSQLSSQHRKVVLGGQGGDEIFGGYTRYLIAYFEQCIKAAINGTMYDGNFIVTYESIIPNLTALRNYQPMLQEFWREGLFDDMDRRYFRLINRATQLGKEVRWDLLGDYSPYETFRDVFYGNNVGKQSYFDLMTHFDFKTLLPALLQVEDRMSMAHGLESRVPLLDHPLVEFAATIPSSAKFTNGTMKHSFKSAFGSLLPESVLARKDKMGFPTPLAEWINGEAHDFIYDVFSSSQALNRELIDNRQVLAKVATEAKYGRSVWGLLCLELWQQTFCDRVFEFTRLLSEEALQ